MIAEGTEEIVINGIALEELGEQIKVGTTVKNL